MPEDFTSIYFHYDVAKVSQEMKVRPEILNRLVLSFSRTLTEKVRLLEAAMFKDDIITMRAILHEVRGTAGNLRLEGIANAGRVMHEAVKSETSKDKVPEYFRTLKAWTQAFNEYIKKQESANVENPNR